MTPLHNAGLIVPAKSLGTDGVNQRGNVRNNAGVLYEYNTGVPGISLAYTGIAEGLLLNFTVQ